MRIGEFYGTNCRVGHRRIWSNLSETAAVENVGLPRREAVDDQGSLLRSHRLRLVAADLSSPPGAGRQAPDDVCSRSRRTVQETSLAWVTDGIPARRVPVDALLLRLAQFERLTRSSYRAAAAECIPPPT